MNTLQEYLKNSGLSPSRLARLVGKPASTVHRHVKGQRRMSFYAAITYARVGVPWKVLKQHEQDMEEKENGISKT